MEQKIITVDKTNIILTLNLNLMMFSFFPVYIFIFNLWDRKEKIEQ